MGHHEDESLIDKVKNALGMGDDHDEHDQEHAGAANRTDAATDERADGWAGVPEALYDDTSATDGTSATHADRGGLGQNPGPLGSARYEGAATADDLGGGDFGPDGELDTTREDAAASEFGGAYGEDDTAMPTTAAYDRGEPPPAGEASFGTEEDTVEAERRETGI